MQPAPSPALSLDNAVAALTQGGVIAYPTEAVWGLGCDPRQQAAVLRLLAIKRRPVDKGVIVVAASVDVLHEWVDFDALEPARKQEVLASWPGPHTWILPVTAQAPRWVTGEHDGLAVRISAHPVVAALCAAWGAPLVSTSANLAGESPARSRQALDPALLASIDGVVDGVVGTLAQPTQIRDARSGQVLRD
ncbi:Sua5/YciO/YrdC/YwlC family protein [Xanthomonas hortorum]|uniref:Threonylcarbamoyl-AMP synthase n=1 Tax=Xanthomonas hortorum pv. pelargonii TaxID=453602 RepID=A0A6V7ET19_9XANT|nr:Sua5/YciO/YrdC/YwlC family protein [Xanthomonas hortorum]MCE4356324.1 Sua5/YciO/YrdC/YwlC family protein [Xanthomonas hortorum pv. pelargonii]MCM5524399.1 Sua5/YciO/YrdC/YwlC family protein [Xanthomonas hortorum pv. pelargonii]MCM5536882.1 Sua5/YciO/YrdC/YwlC family protein [Xanthomonas hortorum pv. pelargonii]MCM5541113.1 Sua5/YciO/YrdC/YwlC family protein [Xanthomonas hortorum pv. pelargonii]MCM5544929.1 Sua5/YciO/YrdC/YwlC family protein [Xanthomonas hortorum pv. pelargonii]